MALASAILGLIFAMVAHGYYRAGAFFDMRYQWKTRQEDPGKFWAVVVLYSVLAAALLSWSVVCLLRSY
jgi:hypothetical protein